MSVLKPAWALSQAARWAVCMAIAMGLSFILVGQLLSRTDSPASSPKEISVAADLRGFSNNLVMLLNEYEARRPGADAGEVNAFERWVQRSFHPKVNDLRYRLLESNLLNAEHSALLAASDRAAAMAAKPRDDRALRAAREAVLEAASRTDRRVAQLKSGFSLVAHPATPTFARQ